MSSRRKQQRSKAAMPQVRYQMIGSFRYQAKFALLHPLLQWLLSVAGLADVSYSKSGAPGRNRTCCLAVRRRGVERQNSI